MCLLFISAGSAVVMSVTLTLVFGSKTGTVPLGLKSIFGDAMVCRVIAPTIINKKERNQRMFDRLPVLERCGVETLMCEA